LADYEIVLWHAIHVEFFSVESFAVRAGQSSGELIFMYELMLSNEWQEKQCIP
jgi:hypothetical protein